LIEIYKYIHRERDGYMDVWIYIQINICKYAYVYICNIDRYIDRYMYRYRYRYRYRYMYTYII